MAEPKWEDTKEVAASVPHWDDTKEVAEPSALEALLRGGASGITLNTAPAISAAVQHPIEAAEAASNPLLRLLGASEFSPEDTKNFNKAREESNNEFKAAEHAHPWVYGAGGVAGSLALAPLIPEVAPGVLGGAALGAGMGAASGAGQALSEGKSFGDIGTSALTQGAVGGVVGGAIGGLAKALTPAELEKNAAKNTVESFGPPKSEVNKLMKAPSVTDDGGSRLQEVGEILNKPTNWTKDGKSVVTAMGDSESRLERLMEAKAKSGEFLGGVAKQVDESGQKLVDPSEIIQYVEQLQKPHLSYDAEKAAQGISKASFPEEFNILQKIKQDLLDVGNGPMSFERAEQIKQDITKKAYGDNGAISNVDIARLRGFVNDKIDSALDTATKNMGNPELFNKYLDAKNMYGAVRQIEKSAYGDAAKQISNNDLGLTDYLMAGAGYSTHGGAGALAAIAAKKFIQGKYNGVAAKTQQWGADTMREISMKVSEQKPEWFSNVGAKMMSSDNETAQKFGRVFSSIADKDQIGRNATIFSLMQIPAYREFMRNVTGN